MISWRWGVRQGHSLRGVSMGAFWEIVAVPDIRDQVAQVADQIAKELSA